MGIEKLSSNDNDRYDAVSIGNGIQVYAHTVATIPEKVSDVDAMSTAAAALVGIHCAIPKVGGVGGSREEVFYSGKASLLFAFLSPDISAPVLYHFVLLSF